MSPTRATLVWCLVGTMALMTIVSFALARLTVDFSSPWLPLAITGLFGMSVFYRYRRPDPHLCAVTEAAAQMLLILLFGILLTYAAMATNFPYRDAELHAIDRALGLDRREYLDFVNSRPLLAELAGYSYQSLLPQFALVPMVLMVAGQLPRLRRWMIAEALRAGTLQSIKLDNLEGLITFPSFHTTGALMFIWAFRTVPFVRGPAAALNISLILATPIDGAHYFIDLVGGATVAFAAIAASYWLCRFARADEDLAVAVPAAPATAKSAGAPI
jgi:membrane-associated phospholipid phosphatase